MPSPRSPHSSKRGTKPSGRTTLIKRVWEPAGDADQLAAEEPIQVQWSSPDSGQISVNKKPASRAGGGEPPDFHAPCQVHDTPWRRVTYGRGGWRGSRCAGEWRQREDGGMGWGAGV